MSAPRIGPGAPAASTESGARTILKLRFPPPADPAPPDWPELLDRIDRLETRQSRRS